jgi:hypothetical protein
MLEKANSYLPILTSLGQQADAAELKAAGIDAYLVKPVGNPASSIVWST